MTISTPSELPTEEMIEAGRKAYAEHHGNLVYLDVSRIEAIYLAMKAREPAVSEVVWRCVACLTEVARNLGPNRCDQCSGTEFEQTGEVRPAVAGDELREKVAEIVEEMGDREDAFELADRIIALTTSKGAGG